jgi:hypothetical protein
MQRCWYYIATYATICNLCNYMKLCCNNFVCNYMKICNYMKLCNLCNYIATYATLRNFIATYATILQLMRLYCNYMQLMLYATICNLCNYMQLGVAISTLCNYMTDRCGNFNFMQLNATICNCVGTKNVYWHNNLSSCFNECRYHQIGICRIYLPRVMIKI